MIIAHGRLVTQSSLAELARRSRPASACARRRPRRCARPRRSGHRSRAHRRATVVMAFDTTTDAVGLDGRRSRRRDLRDDARALRPRGALPRAHNLRRSRRMNILIRAELLKLRSLRSFWWTVAATLAFVPVSIALAECTAAAETRADRHQRGVPQRAWPPPRRAAVLMLDHRHPPDGRRVPPQHDHLDASSITPDRKRVVGAKLAASGIVGVALGIVASLLTLAIALPWLSAAERRPRRPRQRHPRRARGRDRGNGARRTDGRRHRSAA